MFITAFPTCPEECRSLGEREGGGGGLLAVALRNSRGVAIGRKGNKGVILLHLLLAKPPTQSAAFSHSAD